MNGIKKGPAGNKGLIRIIIIIIIALLILGYFNINLRNIVNAPTTQDNISYIATSTVFVWNNYLKAPATYVWGIFINLIWEPALYNLEQMKNGQPTNINTTTPMFPQ